MPVKQLKGLELTAYKQHCQITRSKLIVLPYGVYPTIFCSITLCLLHCCQWMFRKYWKLSYKAP